MDLFEGEERLETSDSRDVLAKGGREGEVSSTCQPDCMRRTRTRAGTHSTTKEELGLFDPDGDISIEMFRSELEEEE